MINGAVSKLFLESKSHQLFCRFKENVLNIFLDPSEKVAIQKKIEEILSGIDSSSKVEKKRKLNAARILILKYQGFSKLKEIVKIFDLKISKYRPEYRLLENGNNALYKKWQRNGFPPELFQHHPEFCAELEEFGLLSQMKITKDLPIEKEGEPAILINGKYTQWSTFKNEFEIEFSPRYKENFIVHKSSRITYTYLDNGLGLQPHHPYLTELSPISKLTDEEYLRIREKGEAFIRTQEEELSQSERELRNAERPHIIQLVTSYIKGPNTRFHNLIINSKHPYIRIIMGQDSAEFKGVKGDVFEVGYGWKNKMAIPFETTQGRFRSPDIWEYNNNCYEKVVTNIPISNQEAKAIYEYTLKYHRDEVNLGKPIGFHLLRQNCSTYVRTALQIAGILVPTKISLLALIRAIAPKQFEFIGNFFQEIKRFCNKFVDYTLNRVLPEKLKSALGFIVNKIVQLFEDLLASLAALGLLPFNALLGGIKGEGGRAFLEPGSIEEKIEPVLKNWKNWFKLSSYEVNLPGILQQWQRQQPSTSIYKNPVRLTIVP